MINTFFILQIFLCRSVSNPILRQFQKFIRYGTLGARGFFSYCWQRKLSGEIFRCQHIVLETCFRNGCSFAVMDLSYTLYLCASVFIIILPLNFRPCPRGLAWLWSFEEELRSIISVCHPPERPFPSPDRPILFF